VNISGISEKISPILLNDSPTSVNGSGISEKISLNSLKFKPMPGENHLPEPDRILLPGEISLPHLDGILLPGSVYLPGHPGIPVSYALLPECAPAAKFPDRRGDERTYSPSLHLGKG